MTPALLLPIRPQALLVKEDRWCASASYDFSRLPYVGKEGDVHADTPFVAGSVAAPAFGRPDQVLEPGLHLHWILPPLLQRTIPPFMANAGRFPAVPNRWLITRLRENQVEKTWVLESDYLHALGATPPNPHQFATYPWFEAYDRTHEPPFRYIGRVYEKNTPPVPSGEDSYLYKHAHGPLTTAGYGDPSFSSFYPNCRSVFGFYDPDGIDFAGLEYRITGYYDPSALDFSREVSAYLRHKSETIWSEVLAGVSDPHKRAEKETSLLEEELRERLRLPVTLRNTSFPQTLYCHGRIVMESTLRHPKETVDVAIANSGPEAITVSLVQELMAESVADVADAESLEDLLESILMHDRISSRLLDVGLKFRELRHEQEFYTTQGGDRWALQSLQGLDAGKKAAVVSSELAQAVASLNTIQQRYDHAQEGINTLRQYTFDHWYCYQLSAYRDEADAGHFPEPDMLKGLIEKRLLKKLEHELATVGRFTIAPRGTYGQVTGGSADGPSTLAADLAGEVQKVLAALRSYDHLGLYTVPGSRYYLPREPVICVSGDPLRGLLHDHSQAGPGTPEYQGYIVDTAGAEALNNGMVKLPKGFVTEIDPAKTWNALMLDWSAQFFPVAGQEKTKWRPDHYPTDYVTTNFDLPDNEPDLSLKAGKGLTEAYPETLEGRSFLNPFAQVEVRDKLLAWCCHALAMPEPADKTKVPPVTIAELRELAGRRDEKDPLTPSLLRVIDALDLLGKGAPRLTQSLTGFNQALLGRKGGWQMEVRDPLGFDSYRQFAQHVGTLVGNQVRSAPLPDRHFHPIRSGEASITGLRLIDSFGQYKDLPIGSVAGATKMTGSKPNRVRLPVRFLQALRLHFRWVDHDPGHPPIAGWLLPEYIEQKLTVFDTDGTALGDLTEEGWTPAPGNPQAPASVNDIADEALRAFCQYVARRTEFNEMLRSIHTSADYIAPDVGEDADLLAFLFGQPLALVHASLGLQLQGNAVTSMSWEACWNHLLYPTDPPSDAGFSTVKIPVRIGEHEQLNDGVVWCWEWQKDDHGLLRIGEVKTQERGRNAHPFEVSAGTAHSHLGLLMHPVATAQATTGVLPVKTLKLPVTYYQKALKNLKGDLNAGPVLTPGDQADPILMPLPRLTQHRWKWVDADPTAANTEAKKWEPGVWRLTDTVTVREGRLQIEDLPDKTGHD